MNRIPLLQLRNVTQCYGPVCVLQVGQLDVFAGEIVCLIGPTGSGKTTLLRLLSGLEPTASGLVRYAAPLGSQSVPPRITMVFQHPLLLSGSVRYNVEYGLRRRGLARKGQEVDPLLDRLNLIPLASRSIRTLSGGQRQLVALARALVLEPTVLLLDEPTANLDPALVALVEGVIIEDNQRQGTTIVWVTHHLFQARRVAHRTGLLLNGQLIEMAPTECFFDHPCDPRTAAFVRGEMVY